jgi:tRNA 2-selenouridine synthase
MIRTLSVTEFLKETDAIPVLDVRSPGEFVQGRIPGALSFPLFSNEERKEVGTLYKQVSPEEALLKGLEFVGPKMAGFVRDAAQMASNRKVALYCWRGGQRSGSMAWLLSTAGFEVILLKGGYKSFRRLVVEAKPVSHRFHVLCGYTGSGKTRILHALEKQGEKILDLEKLAHHKGSAFGTIGENPQPSQEQFENELFYLLNQTSPGDRLWIEDESRAIGRLRIPGFLFEPMSVSPAWLIDRALEDRIAEAVALYGQAPAPVLEESIRKVAKRLGGDGLKAALEAVRSNCLSDAAAILMRYYDKAYRHGIENHSHAALTRVPFPADKSYEELAEILIQNC